MNGENHKQEIGMSTEKTVVSTLQQDDSTFGVDPCDPSNMLSETSKDVI